MPTPPITRTELQTQHLTLNASVLAEIEAARAAGDLDGAPEPRCFICCEAESKKLVNSLLAAGLTNREIVECCADINARRAEKGDTREINARRVWVHRRAHFNIDRPAMATYREIMERRAAEENKDFVNGIGHAITPYAVLETVMVKGYAQVTDDDTKISTKEAMESAVKLHDMTKSDASQRRMADLLYQMDRIIAAAQEFVPASQHEAFLARVEGREPMQALSEAVHAKAEGAIKSFAPPTTVDAEDQI